MKRSHEWLAGLTLALGGLLFSLLAIELGVRWLHLLPDRFWQPDPLLGARLVPGSEGWWTQEEREFLVPVRINRHGLNDAEIDFAKPAGVARVLVLGDSFTEALHVPRDQGFTEVMERALNEKLGRRIEVINAGVSGYGTASATLYFEHEGWRYQPDLVLLAFYPGNDVRNNSPVLEDAFRPVYDDAGSLQRVEATSLASEARRGGLSSYSAALRYLRKLLLTRQPALAQAFADIGLLNPAAIRPPAVAGGIPVGYGMYETPLAADWKAAWTLTESLLDRLRRAVEAKGSRLGILIATTREEIYPDTWEEILAAHPAMQSRQWDLQAPERWILGWCREREVECFSLTPTFMAAAKAGQKLHYRHDGHWNEAGHELAGTLAAELVADHDLLPSR